MGLFPVVDLVLHVCHFFTPLPAQEGSDGYDAHDLDHIGVAGEERRACQACESVASLMSLRVHPHARTHTLQNNPRASPLAENAAPSAPTLTHSDVPCKGLNDVGADHEVEAQHDAARQHDSDVEAVPVPLPVLAILVCVGEHARKHLRYHSG